jgi:hypothetical protein
VGGGGHCCGSLSSGLARVATLEAI